jgi:PRTRC genetic system protein B
MQHILNKFYPKKALIVFQEGERRYRSGKYYIEERDINSKGKMGAAKPLDLDKARDIFKSIITSETKILGGFIPSNVLYYSNKGGTDNIIWYTLPRQQQLFFSKDLGVPDGVASIPGLVFYVQGNNLSVYAYKAAKVNINTPLYEAPFHNINNNHEVCLGNIKKEINRDSFDSFISSFESFFFNSNFTHSNREHKSNINILWKELIEKKGKFPYSKLRKTGKTLKQII